jgi:4-amino-4-deoxy-L-arabinose transferase-like glycosyltransferase
VHWIALAVILALAALLRAVPLTYSHFWDETVFLQHAEVILDGRTNYQEFFHRPPLLSVLYALGFALWDNIYVANIVQAVVTTLAVLFAFLYVRGAFGVVAGMAAAFLFAFTPYLVETSHELLTDMPAVAFMLAAMWLFDKPGRRFALLAGATYALAVQTRFTSLFLIVYFALDAGLSPRKIRQLAILVVAAGVTIAPYLIWARWNYGSFLFPFVLARRIVTEWTAPVASRFYFDAALEIFPPSLWLFFALGLLSPDMRWANAALTSQAKRQLVLLLWGLAFFAYMLTIGHKEVRYLLPLAIPVVIISALGATTLFRWIARQPRPVWAAVVLLGVAVAVADYASPFQKLRGPWTDSSESEEVQIAEYLREHSTPADTIYAAHNFPVLAFYSGRRTVSLLPIQAEFEQVWRRVMAQPGFLVYYPAGGIKETHSKNPHFMPDQQFIDASPEFRLVRSFPSATVYYYEPAGL